MKHLILFGAALLLSISSIYAQEYRHEIRIGHYFPSLVSSDPITGTLPSLHYRYHQSRIAFRLGIRYSPQISSGNFDGSVGTEVMFDLKMLELGIQFQFRKDAQSHIFRPYFFSDLRISNTQLETSDWTSLGLHASLSQQSQSFGIALGPGFSLGYKRLSISYEVGLYLDYSSSTSQETRYFPITSVRDNLREGSFNVYAHGLNILSLDFYF